MYSGTHGHRTSAELCMVKLNAIMGYILHPGGLGRGLGISLVHLGNISHTAFIVYNQGFEWINVLHITKVHDKIFLVNATCILW